MKNIFRTVLALLILYSSLASCSSDQDKKENGIIEQGTDKMTNEAVKAIKTPLDQAKIAAEQENSHIKQVEDQMQKQ